MADEPLIATVEQRLVYENEYVSVFDDRVIFPDGHEGTYYYSRWKAPYGVAIVAVNGGRALLVRTYRYAEQAFSVEIPMGFGVAGRTPAEQAAVELGEETGLKAERFEPLLIVGRNYRTHVFLAQVGAPESVSGARQERTESIVGFEWLPLDEATPEAFAAKGICEPISIAALLAARAAS